MLASVPMHFWGIVAPCAPSKGCKQEKGATVLMGSQDVEHHEGWILEEDLGWHHPPQTCSPQPSTDQHLHGCAGCSPRAACS